MTSLRGSDTMNERATVIKQYEDNFRGKMAACADFAGTCGLNRRKMSNSCFWSSIRAYRTIGRS